MPLESSETIVEIPEEITEYGQISALISQSPDLSELHTVRIKELADSLYSKDEQFKKILDGQMSRVTDQEFDHDGEAENNKDKDQATMDALTEYANELGLKVEKPIRIEVQKTNE